MFPDSMMLKLHSSLKWVQNIQNIYHKYWGPKGPKTDWNKNIHVSHFLLLPHYFTDLLFFSAAKMKFSPGF